MKNVYLCPHCSANLNPNVKIILLVSHRRRKGLILLSPQPGNFKYVCDQHVGEVLKAGARVTFACPVCQADLTSGVHSGFSELYLDVGGRVPERVFFSRKFGTHATFVTKGDVVATYGEDADEFAKINFFGS
jgi:hypothetical protein